MVSVVQRGDVIEDINREFKKHRNAHYLRRHLRDILYKEKVVRSRDVVKPKLINPFSSNIFFACTIDSSANIFGKRIEIVVKPDHDPKDRRIHLLITIGKIIIERDENKDNHKWPTKRILREEEHDIEKDLKKILRKYKKKLGLKK